MEARRSFEQSISEQREVEREKGKEQKNWQIAGSPPTPGSPLTAMQFIRRAERDPSTYRSDTPTKSTRSVAAPPVLATRAPAWRP